MSMPQRGAPLTERQIEILRLIAQGLTNEQIGSRLTISPDTVRTHIRRSMRQLGAVSRAQMVAIGYEEGILGSRSRGRAVRLARKWTMLPGVTVREVALKDAGKTLLAIFQDPNG